MTVEITLTVEDIKLLRKALVAYGNLCISETSATTSLLEIDSLINEGNSSYELVGRIKLALTNKPATDLIFIIE